MFKLLKYCQGCKIFLPKLKYVPIVKAVYSHYQTATGWMFYLSTNKGDKFLEVFKDGRVELTDGWDGGDLNSLAIVKEYYRD